MKYIYLVLIISCVCVHVHVHGQINKPCSQDNDCDVYNKFQCIQNFCRCKIGYRKVDDIASCTLVPGTSCNNPVDCENFPGAVCDENYKCVCKAGYTAGNTECDKVGKIGDFCQNHAACIARTNDTNLECKESLCVCKEGFHEANNRFCQKTAGLDDNCNNNDDCHLIVDDKNALECTPEKICKCREGFKQKGNTCTNGSAGLLAFSLPILGALILGLLKF